MAGKTPPWRLAPSSVRPNHPAKAAPSAFIGAGVPSSRCCRAVDPHASLPSRRPETRPSGRRAAQDSAGDASKPEQSAKCRSPRSFQRVRTNQTKTARLKEPGYRLRTSHRGPAVQALVARARADRDRAARITRRRIFLVVAHGHRERRHRGARRARSCDAHLRPAPDPARDSRRAGGFRRRRTRPPTAGTAQVRARRACVVPVPVWLCVMTPARRRRDGGCVSVAAPMS